MLKENKYRTGIDDQRLTPDEFEQMKNGGTLYKHIIAVERPKQIFLKKKSRNNLKKHHILQYYPYSDRKANNRLRESMQQLKNGQTVVREINTDE